MTFVAFACGEDRATIAVDSLSYLPGCGRLGSTTKLMPLPHIRAAAVSQGDGLFGTEAKMLANSMSADLGADAFDQLGDVLQPILKEYWQPYSEANRFVYDSTLFLIGYSTSQQSFRALHLSSDEDFRPTPITSFYMSPTPFTWRPSELEMARLRPDLAALFEALYPDGEIPPEATPDQVLSDWAQQPEPPQPADLAGWITIADGARVRALSDDLKVLVGGSVYLTELDREGFISTGPILGYDDTGETLLQLVGFSQHPAAQVRPCWCGSGKRHLDCHLADRIDRPCICGSGRLFRDCCMVTTTT